MSTEIGITRINAMLADYRDEKGRPLKEIRALAKARE
jgi:hypothetical protein